MGEGRADSQYPSPLTIGATFRAWNKKEKKDKGKNTHTHKMKKMMVSLWAASQDKGPLEHSALHADTN